MAQEIRTEVKKALRKARFEFNSNKKEVSYMGRAHITVRIRGRDLDIVSSRTKDRDKKYLKIHFSENRRLSVTVEGSDLMDLDRIQFQNLVDRLMITEVIDS